MGKKFSVLVIAIFVIGLMVSPVLAGSPPAAGEKGKTGAAGKSNVAHLYLYEKNPDGWAIVEGGAWGKMKYNLSGSLFDFVFNGHKLGIGVDYTLIYYPDPWPGTGLICLGSGTADEFGNVNIKGAVNTGDLPASYDDNSKPDPYDPEKKLGAKIWLVLSSDVSCGAGMTNWIPDEYLFEYDLITFDDID